MELKKSSELRGIAQEKLSSCWAECISMLLVETGIVSVLILSALLIVKFCYVHGIVQFDIDTFWNNGTPAFFAIAILFILAASMLMAPLRYGISWFCMQIVRGRNVPASSFFSCYMNKTLFTRTIKLHIAVSSRKILLILPAVVLAIAEILIADNALRDADDGFIYTVVLCCLVLLMASMVFMYLFVSMRYSLVPFIFAEKPEKSCAEIINESKQCVCGYESYILEMFFSAGLWIVSCVFIFPLIYVLPYIQMMFTVAAKELIDYNDGDMSSSVKRYSPSHKKEESTFV